MGDLITIMGTEGRGVAMKECTRRTASAHGTGVCVWTDGPRRPLGFNAYLISHVCVAVFLPLTPAVTWVHSL